MEDGQLELKMTWWAARAPVAAMVVATIARVTREAKEGMASGGML